MEASAFTLLLFTTVTTSPLTAAPPPETAMPAAPMNWVSFAFAPTYTPCALSPDSARVASPPPKPLTVLLPRSVMISLFLTMVSIVAPTEDDVPDTAMLPAASTV